MADPSSTALEAVKQSIRLHRFLLATVFSLLYLLVLMVFYFADAMAGRTLVEAAAIVAAFVLAFFLLFRSGLNLRSPDPSLTAWQMLAAVATMLYVIYYAPNTRVAFNAFFFIAFMFGMLRHGPWQLAGLGSLSLVAFALVIWLRYTRNQDAAMVRLDALQWIVMTLTFPWFVLIGQQVKRLRHGLREVSVRLEDIEEQARRDELTGVYNRRALLAAMEEAKQRADSGHAPLSICIIDLDFFKRFNDEVSHLAGDQVLRLFTQAAQSGLRASDIFGRYGGEEFVQILAHTPLDGAMGEAERLRLRIAAIELPVPPLLCPLTVSVGVAQYRPGEAIMQTFARADAALYKAKQSGRNRVAH
jgi:diguanylate cyclase (GGDEF)-like protein